jgi:hypothetical protein
VRRVVLIFKVAVAAVAPLGVTEPGEAVQVASAGMPVQVRDTPESNPDKDFTLRATLVEFPATTVAVVGFTAMPKSDPAPVNVTTCGLLGALSVIVKAPERVPTALGVKVTLIVQEAPVPRLWPQLVLSEKSPLGVILVMLKLAVPELVRVIAWELLLVCNGSLAKVRTEDERVTNGPPCPVPSKATV